MNSFHPTQNTTYWAIACAVWVCWPASSDAGELLKNSDFSRGIVVVGDEQQRIDFFGKSGNWYFVDGGPEKGAWTLSDGVLRVGSVVAALGFGVHAPEHLVVDLPPGAKTFSCIVGIDHAVRYANGCVRCRIVGADRERPLWSSQWIRAKDDPVRVGPLEISNTTRLELIAEMAHRDRPQGAAPFDIGDHVDWLYPTITVDLQPTSVTLSREEP